MFLNLAIQINIILINSNGLITQHIIKQQKQEFSTLMI